MKMTNEQVKRCETNLLTISTSLEAANRAANLLDHIQREHAHAGTRAAAKRASALVDRVFEIGLAHLIEIDELLTAHEAAVEAEKEAEADVVPIEKGAPDA